MIHIDLNSVILLALGSILTLVGSITTNYITQTITHRAESTKIIRDKIEELYTLYEELSRKIHTQTIEWDEGKESECQEIISKMKMVVFLYDLDIKEEFDNLLKNSYYIIIYKNKYIIAIEEDTKNEIVLKVLKSSSSYAEAQSKFIVKMLLLMKKRDEYHHRFKRIILY